MRTDLTRAKIPERPIALKIATRVAVCHWLGTYFLTKMFRRGLARLAAAAGVCGATAVAAERGGGVVALSEGNAAAPVAKNKGGEVNMQGLASRPAAYTATGAAVRQAATLAELIAATRAGSEVVFEQWHGDELGWTKLPPRAWPPRQFDWDEAEGLTKRLVDLGCPATGNPMSEDCSAAYFDFATAMVFTGVELESGRGL